jgi:peptidoglycan/xylan/chitin deacetylase (PgdA/CDA1 family)
LILRWLFGALSPAGSRGRLSVMILHRVLAQPDPLFPGEIDASRFDALINRLKQWFNIISLSDGITGLRSGRFPSRPLVITFDDGYADNRTVALPILQRHRITASFFVACGFLDGGRMWNDTVIEAVRRWRTPVLDLADLGLGTYPVTSHGERHVALGQILPRLKYWPQAEREATALEIARRCGTGLPDDLMLTTRQLLDLHEAGMTIGAHTVTHPILATLSDEIAKREIAESRTRIEALLGDEVLYFAYPNGKPGKDFKAVHVAMVRDLGFEAAVSTAWGACGSGGDLYQIPRFTPWDASAVRFGLRMAQNLTRKSYVTA